MCKAPDMAVMQPSAQTSPWQELVLALTLFLQGWDGGDIYATAAALSHFSSVRLLCDPKLKTVQETI